MKTVLGIHAAKSALEHRTNEVQEVLLSSKRTDRRLNQIESIANRNDLQVRRISNSQLSELAKGNKHQGVVLICDTDSRKSSLSLKKWIGTLSESSIIVVLDSISDPRNLGACIRSAHAAGAAGVILPKHRGCRVNTTVSRTAAGAVEVTPIFEISNLSRTLEFFKENGFWVVGLHPAGTSQTLYSTDLSEPCVLVFGSEGSGLRRETSKKCDVLVQIPMFGKVESVNVSVAVGVATFEAMRQRLKT